MLEQGTVEFDTPEFRLSLVRSSQTVAALKARKAGEFDFAPGDILAARSRDGYYHLGDLDLRVRVGDSGAWRSYSTALERKPVKVLPAENGVLASADLTPSLPRDFPLQLTRTWAVERGKLVLRFVLKNNTRNAVQVGALGIPMVFNNVINDRTLDEAHAKCVFYDPYIGGDAGYLQVTRLNGQGPALLVVPEGKTPFEAYNPILESRHGAGESESPIIFHDPTPRGMTFEGFYDWMVHSQAFAEDEWKKAEPWLPPTMLTLAPGESKSYGLRFVLSDSIRGIESTLAANSRPVAVGVPGYVLPMDTEARLFLKYPKPVKAMNVVPAGAMEITRETPTASGWKVYRVSGKAWGRARLEVAYEDGLTQTISYTVIKPAAQAVADMGHFLTTKQWFVDPQDPFHRSPSVMSYDRETDQIVTQDSRVWIAGLGDEGGSGSWLAAFMKELGQPDKQEIGKLEQFVDNVLFGVLQYKDGPNKYGVRKSVFYYQPDQLGANYYRSDLNWKTWTSWNKEASEKVDRAFNYPHVAAAYWVMYRLSRNNDGLVTNHPWQWYLDNAYETTIAMFKLAPYYTDFGLMEGDVFVEILKDLRREGMSDKAALFEAKMGERADKWKEQAYPFGSEMPWDSTGQEEVYAWTKYFGYQDKAAVTLNAILGYDPTVPHWGYNGSARRFWDFLYGGKYSRIERQLHHYGSGINAIPLLSAYRDHPDDLYLLRVGYGGMMGALTNIDREGFASAAFHSFPDMLKFDPLSGDYGPNFFGHAMNAATYVVESRDFGWLAFGGNLKQEHGVISVAPRDSFRTRLYVAPAGLWLTLDSGRFEKVEFNPKTGLVRVALAPANEFTHTAHLRVEEPGKEKASYTIKAPTERGAYVMRLGKVSQWVVLEKGNSR